MVTDQVTNMTKWIYLFLAQVQVIAESYRCEDMATKCQYRSASQSGCKRNVLHANINRAVIEVVSQVLEFIPLMSTSKGDEICERL